MSKTFFDGTSGYSGDKVSLTRFCGPSTLLDKEKTRECLQIDVQCDGKSGYAKLTYAEAFQLRHQLTRFLSHMVTDLSDEEGFNSDP